MKKEYDMSIHDNPDAEAWNDFYWEAWPNGCPDKDNMHGWFANAMMAMSDDVHRRIRIKTAKQESIEKLIEECRDLIPVTIAEDALIIDYMKRILEVTK